MAPLLGEIRIFAGNFPPNGWAFCWGQQVPISENDTLFQLIGTTYGGDGENYFNLPDLQSRAPIHIGTNPSTGTNYIIGETGGVESVTLTTNTLPSHTHPLLGSTDVGSLPDPGGNLPAQSHTANAYAYLDDVTNQNMFASAIQSVGGNQPHDNVQPYLAVNYILSLFGVFPFS